MLVLETSATHVDWEFDSPQAHMKKNNKKKSEQLGMNFSTANNRLKKKILFWLVRKCGLDKCYRCGHLIESEEELSIEHMVDWLDNNPALFWDMNNIDFSHLKCNIDNSDRSKGHLKKHGRARYGKGCRCVDCTKANRIHVREFRSVAKRQTQSS